MTAARSKQPRQTPEGTATALRSLRQPSSRLVSEVRQNFPPHVLNIALLILVFGAEKKKISPYTAALALGVIKGVIYAVFSHSLVIALVMGVIFAAMSAGFVYFLKRVDRREEGERPEVPTYTSAGSDTIKFKWEYIPLVILLVLIVGGEMLLQ
jgi:hypothetical protein